MIRYMEISESHFEIEARVYDLVSNTIFIKHFHMRGTDNSYESVLDFCYERAHLYGVEEIRVGGAAAYDYFKKNSHTADPWFENITQFSNSRLW